MKEVEIHTDGSCLGNPGPGGWGAVLRYQGRERELSGGEPLTTNNRMELMAVIVALGKLKSPDNDVHVFTDSKYVADAINQKWIYGWIKRGWKNVKNPDLWKEFYTLYQLHEPKFHWIKGHAGHPENEICDQLAVAATKSGKLETDAYFENQNEGGLF